MNFIQEAFDDNWVSPLGPNVNGFENDLEQYLGENVHVAALSSGTAALHLALIQLGVEAGDEVICQSMTFAASANPIIYLGAQPVFIDSEAETWNMCPDALRTALEDRSQAGVKPKAIIVVHLYGMPAKMDEIMALADAYGVPVIEDAAEALGSKYKGRACGTFGRFGVFSFNGNKIITTSGGGALVCHSEEDKEQAVFLATQARDVAPHYEHSQIGYNYRMSNVCAGIGRGQMLVLNERVAARRAMTDFYQSLLGHLPGVTVFTGTAEFRSNQEEFYSNNWLSAILFDSSEPDARERVEALRHAFLAAYIESRPLWKPMHMQPVFADALYFGSNVAEQLFTHGLCLPSGSNLGDAERTRIAAVLRAFFEIDSQAQATYKLEYLQ